MGGDLGPRATIPASIQFAAKFLDTQLTIFACADTLQSPEIKSLILPSQSLNNIRIVNADSVITMDESPLNALRNKLNSSMAMALKALEAGEADVCISSGNTGALMALGCHILGTFENLKRPAICKAIPTVTGHSYMLDLGANTNSDVDQLANFARMGAALAESMNRISKPKVALLNIGTEDIKGSQLIKQAQEVLQQDPQIHYTGFIEGDSIYSGNVDVIVCDGFVGNVALKVSEGVAKMALSQLKEAFKQNLYGRLLGRFAQPLLRKWHKQFDPARYNGAYFLGLNKPVIKSHGSADQRSFTCALEQAHDMAAKDLVGRLKQRCVSQSFNEQIEGL